MKEQSTRPARRYASVHSTEHHESSGGIYVYVYIRHTIYTQRTRSLVIHNSTNMYTPPIDTSTSQVSSAEYLDFKGIGGVPVQNAVRVHCNGQTLSSALALEQRVRRQQRQHGTIFITRGLAQYLQVKGLFLMPRGVNAAVRVNACPSSCAPACELYVGVLSMSMSIRTPHHTTQHVHFKLSSRSNCLTIRWGGYWYRSDQSHLFPQNTRQWELFGLVC